MARLAAGEQTMGRNCLAVHRYFQICLLFTLLLSCLASMGVRVAPPIRHKPDFESLTPKQRKFVNEYLTNGEQGANAYRAAYSSTAADSTCGRAANKMLSHPIIGPIIKDAKRRAAEAVRESAIRFVVTKERISQNLASMAFTNPKHLFRRTANGLELLPVDEWPDEAAIAISEIVETRPAKGASTFRFKLIDRRQATVDLAKLHGLMIDRTSIRLVRSVTDLTDDELDALAAEGLPQIEGTAEDVEE